jgi:hypothetical protein
MDARARRWIQWSSLLGIALFSVGLYLLQSWRMQGFGFPLDDSWIHQTYARNLVQEGVWAFHSQQASSGSTAPLWTLLLSVGYLIGAHPKLWSYGLGVLLLGLSAWTAATWFGQRSGKDAPWSLAMAGLVFAEWHLVWGALSGMEVIAEILVILAMFWLLEKDGQPGWLLGGLVGLGMWIRPDAVTLVLPMTWSWFLGRPIDFSSRHRRILQALAGAFLMLIPYLLLNYTHSGSLWPSTYYAKQAEYAVLRDLPFWRRLIRMAQQPLVGVGAVLLPGLLYSAIRDIRARAWRRLGALVWIGSFIALYALRLPVVYQHGRYLMPVIPVLLLLGMQGMHTWCERMSVSGWRWVLGRAWQATTVIVSGTFLVLGSRAYARDVAIIETEMVAAARWISERTPPNALVAAHDIGALGYYGERPIVDLAGLVSPEVVPFMRDERALVRYLDEQKADYLMTFPDWYPLLTARAEPVFRTEEIYSPAVGGENMTVYRWEP